jgi:hypothetical protein
MYFDGVSRSSSDSALRTRLPSEDVSSIFPLQLAFDSASGEDQDGQSRRDAFCSMFGTERANARNGYD